MIFEVNPKTSHFLPVVGTSIRLCPLEQIILGPIQVGPQNRSLNVPACLGCTSAF